MKKYKFRLDTILEYRSYLEKVAMLELAKLKIELIQIKEHIKNLEENKIITIRILLNLENNGMEVKHFRIHENYIKGIEKEIKDCEKIIAELEKEMMKKKNEMDLQRKKKETLETMKKNGNIKHMEKYYVEEIKEYDDIINGRGKKHVWGI